MKNTNEKIKNNYHIVDFKILSCAIFFLFSPVGGATSFTDFLDSL